ncbi:MULTISPECIES: GNAT family N-acetyltransferase [unclassified Streptomyces]|uniref:GNAT family N-acetyltransferase n=1 Tax=unclassified Streptomyces TaxID=2593676 RepID=UPI00365546EE
MTGGWEDATDPVEVHTLLEACDAYQAEVTDTPRPVRRTETTSAFVTAGHVRLLREHGRAVGMFTLTTRPGAEGPAGQPYAARPAYLSRLAVAPDHLAAGSLIGARCVREAIRLAVALGADAIRAEANPDIRSTRTLLESLGFEQFGPVHSDDTGRRFVHIHKPLAVRKNEQ